MKEALYFGLEYSPIKLDPKLPNPTVIPCRIFAINNSRKDEDNVNKIHEHIIIIELSRKENLRPMYFMIIQVIIDPMNMNNPRTDAKKKEGLILVIILKNSYNNMVCYSIRSNYIKLVS